MVTEFVVGKYYRLNTKLERWKTIFNNRMDPLKDGKPRKCLAVVRFPDALATHVGFEGIIYDVASSKVGWYYYMEDFEEVTITRTMADVYADLMKGTGPKFSYDTDDGAQCLRMEEIIDDSGGEQMELQNIKKNNLKEAQRQFNEERMNEEVAFAKEQLRNATDAINSLDRDIKILEERKKPFLEIISKFGGAQ